MCCELVGYEAGFPFDGVVAVDAAVVAVDEIDALLGKTRGARDEEQQQGDARSPAGCRQPAHAAEFAQNCSGYAVENSKSVAR